MRKDMSDEAFRSVEDAANFILDREGKESADSASTRYIEGDLIFAREHNETWILHQGNEVFHSYPIDSGKPASVFYPADWVNVVERIKQKAEIATTGEQEESS